MTKSDCSRLPIDQELAQVEYLSIHKSQNFKMNYDLFEGGMGGGGSQHNLIPPLMYQLTKIDVPHSIPILKV